MSHDRRAEFLRLREAGMRYADIAERWGMHEDGVQKWARRNGLSQPQTVYAIAAREAAVARAEAWGARIRAGETIEAIAAECGMQPRNLATKLREYRIDVPRALVTKTKHRPQEDWPALVEKVRALVNEGRTRPQIAEALGITIGKVAAAVARSPMPYQRRTEAQLANAAKQQAGMFSHMRRRLPPPTPDEAARAVAEWLARNSVTRLPSPQTIDGNNYGCGWFGRRPK